MRMVPKGVGAFVLVVLLVGVSYAASSILFGQVFDIVIVEGPTNMITSTYSLGSVLRGGSVECRVPVSGVAWDSNDYAGGVEVRLLLGGSAGNYSVFSVDLYSVAVIGDDLLVGVFNASSPLVFETLKDQQYYYVFDFTVSLNASKGSAPVSVQVVFG